LTRITHADAAHEGLYTRVKKDLNRTTRKELDLHELELEAALRSRHELKCLHALLAPS